MVVTDSKLNIKGRRIQSLFEDIRAYCYITFAIKKFFGRSDPVPVRSVVDLHETDVEICRRAGFNEKDGFRFAVREMADLRRIVVDGPRPGAGKPIPIEPPGLHQGNGIEQVGVKAFFKGYTFPPTSR